MPVTTLNPTVHDKIVRDILKFGEETYTTSRTVKTQFNETIFTFAIYGRDYGIDEIHKEIYGGDLRIPFTVRLQTRLWSEHAEVNAAGEITTTAGITPDYILDDLSYIAHNKFLHALEPLHASAPA